MRVLHLFNEIKYSGAELMYAKAASIFQKNGIEMYAFSTGEKMGDFAEIFKKHNIKVYHFLYKKSRFISINKLKYYFTFYKFLKNNRIDVLHIHRNDIYFLGFVARLLGVPTIKTMHSVFKNPFYSYPFAVFRRWMARKFYKVTFQTIGESVYNNELKYYKNPSILINNWYDDLSFYPATSIDEKLNIRKQLKIDKNVIVVTSVGGCSNIKRHNDIIKAVSLLAKDDNVLYLHLGTGEIEDEERELARKLGVISRINFLGNKNNVRDYLVASDIFVMTSKQEGMSIAALEAMACGLPLLFYNSMGLRDLIKNNNNGFLIEPEPEMIELKVREYINKPELMLEKGRSSLNFVKEHFFMKTNVHAIINLYSKVSK